MAKQSRQEKALETRGFDASRRDMSKFPKTRSTADKLDALKQGRELPVDPYAMAHAAHFGTDESAVHALAIAYAQKEEPDYICVSWAIQVRAAEYFNAHGLIATLDECLRVGGPNALD